MRTRNGNACYGPGASILVMNDMSQRLPIPVLASLTAALLAATGCGRVGLELKGELDTAVQSGGLGLNDTGLIDTSDTDNPNDTADTADTAGGSTSPAVYRSNNFEPEDWRDVMWRTRKSRRRGL